MSNLKESERSSDLSKVNKLKKISPICLKVDTKLLYPSVDKKILMNLLRSKFRDEDSLDIIEGQLY